MIKNRNKIILFLVIICLLVGSFLLINNKDIKVKCFSSKSKKYNAVNPTDGKKVAGCDLWFEDIENQFVSYKDVVGNDQNLFIVNRNKYLFKNTCYIGHNISEYLFYTF